MSALDRFMPKEPSKPKENVISVPEETIVPKSSLDKFRKQYDIKPVEDYVPLKEGPAFPSSSHRIIASFATNPEEKLNYFKREFPKEYDFAQKGDIIFWRKKGGTFYHPIDPSGLGSEGRIKEGFTDVFEQTPTAIEMGLSGGGAALGEIPGAVIGGALGNVAKQSIGNIMGVNDTTPKEEETAAQYLHRISPDVNEVITSALLSGAGEGLGKIASRLIKPKLFSNSSVKIPGDILNTQRPIPPSEILGKMGQGIESLNQSIGSPYARSLRKEQEKVAGNILKSSEKFLAPEGEVPKTFAQLRQELPKSLKQDENILKDYFKEGYDEISDSVSSRKLDKTELLSSLKTMQPINDEAKKSLNILHDRIQKMENVSDLLNFKQSDTYKKLVQSGKSSISRELGSINDIIDLGLKNNISKIGSGGDELVKDLDNLNKQYRDFKNTAKILSSLYKSPEFLNATSPEKKIMQKLALQNLPSEIEYPSGFTQNLYERTLASSLPEKTITPQGVDMSKLQELMRDPKIQEYLKNLTSKENTQFGVSDYSKALDVLKKTSEQYVPKELVPKISSLRDLGGLGLNLLNLPISQAAYNPLGTAGRFGTKGLEQSLLEAINKKSETKGITGQ